MLIALAVLAGAVWGVLVSLLGMLITKRCLEKGSTGAVMAGSLSRTVVDVAALGLVYLLRDTVPLPYTYMLIGTAIGLSVATIVYSFRLAGKK